MEPLDNQVKGGGSDDIEIPINSGSIPHFVRRSIKIGQTDIFWHPDAPTLQKSADRKLVNEQ